MTIKKSSNRDVGSWGDYFFFLGNKEQSEPAENTCIKATFDLFAVALRK